MNNVTKIIVAVVVVLSGNACAMESTQIFQGAACVPHMPMLSALRVETFREFPYLYVGDEESEKMYTEDYANSPEALFALSYVQEGTSQFAGILAGIPLACISKKYLEGQEICDQAGLNVSEYYYFGEVITIKQFRNRGVATNLFNLLEARVKSWGYKYACFITSEREENHPLRPEGYKGSDSLWIRLGYTKTDMRIPYIWPTLQSDGSVEDASNIIAVWIKEL